jgi:peptide/nickel transport system substrate-binding protein
LILVASILVTLAACSGGSSTPQDSPAAAASERHGGQATVLLSSAFAGFWPAGLDPATNYTGGANVSLMNAIYGGLFQLTADEDGSNAKVTGVLAESYEIAEEGRALVIRLRPGVTFSDGTPFDAETVKAGMATLSVKISAFWVR